MSPAWAYPGQGTIRERAACFFVYGQALFGTAGVLLRLSSCFFWESKLLLHHNQSCVVFREEWHGRGLHSTTCCPGHVPWFLVQVTSPEFRDLVKAL